MYDVNPNAIIQMIKGGYNPEQLMLNILQGPMAQTPLGANLLALAKNGDRAGIERVARNMCAEKGIDFDSEFTNFKKSLGV